MRAALEQSVAQRLLRTLPKDRFQHVMGVTDLAGKLADAHKMDPVRARIAGILHDMARCWKNKQLVQYALKHHLKVPQFEFVREYQPVLIHSYVSAHMARTLFRVTDPEILSAIEKHSTGAVDMTKFEKLIFLADLLAPDRTFSGANKLRVMARKDLDKAFVEALRIKMEYLLKTHSIIHPDAVKIWNAHAPETGRA